MSGFIGGPYMPPADEMREVDVYVEVGLAYSEASGHWHADLFLMRVPRTDMDVEGNMREDFELRITGPAAVTKERALENTLDTLESFAGLAVRKIVQEPAREIVNGNIDTEAEGMPVVTLVLHEPEGD